MYQYYCYHSIKNNDADAGHSHCLHPPHDLRTPAYTRTYRCLEPITEGHRKGIRDKLVKRERKRTAEKEQRNSQEVER